MVQISFPCDKDWNAMEPDENGSRFCKSCSKYVSDYTNSSSPKNIKGCGRFKLSQISKIKKQITIPALSVYTASLLTIIGVTADIKDVRAQSNEVIMNQKENIDGKIKLNGVVIEKSTNDPLPFVQINVLDSSKVVISEIITDFDGKFEIEFDSNNKLLDDISLVFKYVGYKTDTIDFDKIKDFKSEFIVNLETEMLTDSIVIEKYILTGLVDTDHRIKLKK